MLGILDNFGMLNFMSGNHDNFSDFDVNCLSITNFKFIRRKLGYGLKKNFII